MNSRRENMAPVYSIGGFCVINWFIFLISGLLIFAIIYTYGENNIKYIVENTRRLPLELTMS
jgi:hypothetical protein